MTLTIVKRFNGKGKEIDETYQPVIPELVVLLSEVYQKLNASENPHTFLVKKGSDTIPA